LDEQLVEPNARGHHRRKRIPRLRAMPKRLPRSRTLKGDPKLAYYDSAGGAQGEPPIVLLHGATFRSEDWENIFPRLATRYRVIAYDARGHGKSGRAASYAIDALADDLLRVIDTVAGRPAIVIGHSLGGGTALVAAAKRPAANELLISRERHCRRPYVLLVLRYTTCRRSAPIRRIDIDQLHHPIGVGSGRRNEELR